MAKIWKEKRARYYWKNSLSPAYIYFIEVCSFTFQFTDIQHMKEVREWFATPIHKSSRLPDSTWLRAEHDVAQRWHERLPASIKKGSKRNRVIKALDLAIDKFS